MEKLIGIEEAPLWTRGDSHIKRGYRKQLMSIRSCLLSLLYLHNETCNIWSHIIPAMIHCIVLAWQQIRDPLTYGVHGNQSNTLVVQAYRGSCIVCLLCSSMYHTFNVHSEQLARKCLKLDYLGIVVNTTAGCVASTWFGFRDHAHLQRTYIGLSLTTAATVFCLLLAPSADGPTTAVWRSMLFIAFVATGYLPMLHSYLISGAQGLITFPVMDVLIMEFFYLIGVSFYLTRFPECVYPDTFDIWGSSHQIFHCMVVLGQLAYVAGLEQLAMQAGSLPWISYHA